MSTYQKAKIKKFFVSMFWNGGMMLLAFMIDAIAQNLGIFNLSPEMTAFLGIVLGRVSKALNVYMQENKQLA